MGPASQPVAVYLDRIEKISRDSPHLLLAHAYTQHMAILAGGQILRRSVRSTMQIAHDEPGTAVFELQVGVSPHGDKQNFFTEPFSGRNIANYAWTLHSCTAWQS